MSDDPRPNGRFHFARWLATILSVAVIVFCWQMMTFKLRALSAESFAAAAQKQISFSERRIAELEAQQAAREAEFAARSEELRQREAAIAGREDAATERTQSSFQGLLIQQNLLKNLEALKASLPEMTPEVERLAKEHAQFDAEVQRLRKENAELRRRLNSAAPLESR